MRSFTIEVNGLPQRGLWRLEADDGIEVRTDYGTVWATLSGRDPAMVAREILTGLVPPLANELRRSQASSNRPARSSLQRVAP